MSRNLRKYKRLKARVITVFVGQLLVKYLAVAFVRQPNCWKFTLYNHSTVEVVVK